jgi:hypothetical protein
VALAPPPGVSAYAALAGGAPPTSDTAHMW